MGANFDPEALAKSVADFVTRLETIEAQVEKYINAVEPVLMIFAPFLPAPIGTALQDLPALQIEISKIKNFVNNTLPQVESMLGIPGVGATQEFGVMAPTSEFQMKPVKAVHLDAAKVGAFSGETANTEQATAAPIAPAGMRFVTINGQQVLEQIPPQE